MEKSVERTQRTVIRCLFGIVFGLILLIGGIWGGHDLYVRWQEKRLVRRATFDIEHGNERDASLAARSILQMKPSSASGARIMAELAERVDERAALDWRRKVVELAPHSVDDAMALVRCAIQFNDIPTAERTLAAVDDSARTSASYHQASALVAQSKHEDGKAEAEWSEALRLKPDDKSFQLQLGVLRVHPHPVVVLLPRLGLERQTLLAPARLRQAEPQDESKHNAAKPPSASSSRDRISSPRVRPGGRPERPRSPHVRLEFPERSPRSPRS